MRTFRLTSVVLGLAAAAAPLGAQSDELAALREQLRVLEQRILVLEGKQEVKVEAATTAGASAAKLTASDGRVEIVSGDAATALRLRGLIQADARVYFGDKGAVNDAWVLRRARLITEGVFARNFSFQLVTEFGGSGSPSILDANLNFAWSKALQLRAGKFKAPAGLEQLQSDTWTFFNERSIATNLVPNRDLGLQAWGDLAQGRVSYALGMFNGVADGASSTNADFDNGKDFVGRLMFSPFRNHEGSVLKGLQLGAGGSLGRQKSVAGRAAGFRSDGQQTFFTYLPVVFADGDTWRVSPQFDFRHGAFGLLGEYVLSTVNVRPASGAAKAELQNRAWQVGAGFVLTGEESSAGGVTPRAALNPANGTWGAFEIVGRLARLEVDDATFPLFASPALSAADATSVGLGLNWYLSKAAMLKIDYYQTDFGLAGPPSSILTNPVLRQDEQALITRFQLGF